MEKNCNEVRLDKWLWAARFFKTRSLASKAIDGGKVHLNGHRAKSAKMVHINDQLRISNESGEKQVIVQALSDQRGPASVAVTLYQETPESIEKRERQRELRQLGAQVSHEHGYRPTKRDRRDLDRLRDLFRDD